MDEDLKTFSQRLDYAIKMRGFTKGEFANLLDMPQSSLSRWFRTNHISLENMQRVASVLNVPIEWLAKGGELPRLTSNIVVIDNDETRLPDDVIKVPEYHVNFCCGGGAYEPTFEELHNALPSFYRRSWCREKHIDPKYLVKVKAVGDSMEPVILPGDFVLVDTSPEAREYKQPNKIYAYATSNGTLSIKRIKRLENGEIELTSDNPNYYPIRMTAEEFAQQIKVLGQVIERSGSIQ